MQLRTQRFEAETLQEGIDSYSMNMSNRLHFGFGLKNVSHARAEGVGPRYGMSPIPNHAHNEDKVAPFPVGIRNAENTPYPIGFDNRTKFYQVLPMNYRLYDDAETKKTHFVWVNASDISAGNSNQMLNFSISSLLYVAPTVEYRWVADIGSGISFSEYNSGSLSFENLRINNTAGTMRELDSDKAYIRTAIYQPPTKTFTQRFLVGSKSTDATATEPPYMSMNSRSAGVPPSLILRRFERSTRNVYFYGMTSNGYMTYRYEYDDKSVSSDSFTSSGLEPIGGTAVGVFATADWGAADTVINRLDGDTPTPSDATQGVYVDDTMVISSAYQIIMSATGRGACAAIVQDHMWGYQTTPFQWMDLTNQYPARPKLRNTIEQGSSSTPYVEDDVQTKTCWKYWPKIELSGTTKTPTLAAIEAANERDGNHHVALGAAGSGLLEANTRYEFTFSYFDKSTGHETNVGEPALVVTDSDDNVCLYLFLQKTGVLSGGAFTVDGSAPTNSGTAFAAQQVASAQSVPFPIPSDVQFYPNYLQLRVYYREEGTFEWLPAGAIDYTEYMYNPDLVDWKVCQKAIAALPGGQPGGFIDYSQLPQDAWDDVAVFNERAWWSSPSQVSYSLRGDPLSYPVRNSIACPKGEFRGILPHTFYGQAEQTGRLIIFGSEETYFAEFTGKQVQFPVRVSPDTVATFPADGSDLDVKLRSTITAFSSKAAVVADGILYFWGPSGIFADNGVGEPQRISDDIEPDLFELYDKGDVLNIHCTYNRTTKEVIWFYKPKTTQSQQQQVMFIPPVDESVKTKALVYRTRYGKWLSWDFECRVDQATQCEISNTSVDRGIAGNRTVISVREDEDASISRPVFFDERNNSGDYCFGRELLVKQIALVSGTRWRLTLADGWDSSTLATISIGDTLSSPSAEEYNGTAYLPEAIWEVSGVNVLDGTIDIEAFGTTTPTAVTISDPSYLIPVYVSSTHGIDWAIETNQWAPGGLRLFYNWYEFHMLWSVDLLDSDASQTATFEYRSNLRNDYSNRTLTITDNSQGFYQVVGQFVPDQLAHYGQSMQIKVSGEAIGGKMALQYVAVEAEPLEMGHTQAFEG